MLKWLAVVDIFFFLTPPPPQKKKFTEKGKDTNHCTVICYMHKKNHHVSLLLAHIEWLDKLTQTPILVEVHII